MVTVVPSGYKVMIGCVCIVHVTVVLMSTCRAPVRELELTRSFLNVLVPPVSRVSRQNTFRSVWILLQIIGLLKPRAAALGPVSASAGLVPRVLMGC